jgi:type I restriction enzyme S subunit
MRNSQANSIIDRIKNDAVGRLPLHWKVCSVDELIHDSVLDPIQDGNHGESHPTSDDYVASGVLFLMSNYIRNGHVRMNNCKYLPLELARSLRVGHAKRGDVLLTHKGNDLGRTAILTDIDWAVLTPQVTYYRVRDRNRLDPHFLKLVFESPTFQHQFKRDADQSTRPFVSITNQRRLFLPIPPVNEQRAIVYLLGSLDDKIELNRQNNETLEAIARAIFKSWFIDFDPVRARMEGHQPVGMDSETAALFPNSLADLDLGDIPKGWRVGSFDETIELIGGGTPKTTILEYWGGNIPWFSVVDAPDTSNVFVIDTEKKITQKGLEESSARLLAKGTTIISARGTVGKCALVGVPMAMNQSCYGIRGKHDRGDYFTYFSLRNLVSDLQRSTHGSVFDTVTRDTFKAVQALIMPTELTRAFDKQVSSFLDRVLTNLRESRILATIRDTLLPKLLSGEIRVNNAERFIEAQHESLVC